MIDGTFPETARAARDLLTNSVSRRAQWFPALVFGRSKDGNAGTMDGVGNMGRASIVADKEIQFANNGSQSTERSLPGEIHRWHLYIPHNLFYGHLFPRTTRKYNLSIEALGQRISDGGEVLGRPAPRGWP